MNRQNGRQYAHPGEDQSKKDQYIAISNEVQALSPAATGHIKKVVGREVHEAIVPVCHALFSLQIKANKLEAWKKEEERRISIKGSPASRSSRVIR